MLYFVDESGIDLKEAPFSVLACVGFPPSRVWPFAQDFIALRDEVLQFSPERAYEVKGAKLLKRRVYRQAAMESQIDPEERSEAIRSMLQKNERGELVNPRELAA